MRSICIWLFLSTAFCGTPIWAQSTVSWIDSGAWWNGQAWEAWGSAWYEADYSTQMYYEICLNVYLTDSNNNILDYNYDQNHGSVYAYVSAEVEGGYKYFVEADPVIHPLYQEACYPGLADVMDYYAFTTENINWSDYYTYYAPNNGTVCSDGWEPQGSGFSEVDVCNCGGDPIYSYSDIYGTWYPQGGEVWCRTDNSNPYYNCIAWSVGLTNCWVQSAWDYYPPPSYGGWLYIVDYELGDRDHIPEIEEWNSFYALFGLYPAGEYDRSDVGFILGGDALHAFNLWSCRPQWESKCGTGIRLTHGKRRLDRYLGDIHFYTSSGPNPLNTGFSRPFGEMGQAIDTIINNIFAQHRE